MSQAFTSSPPMTRPLRVLALHSFRTSASILRKQMSLAGLDTALADIVEFTYVNAPHPASGLIPSDVVSIFEGPYYEYWNADKDEQGVWHYHGAKATLDFFAEYISKHGPFDGVMGFSQGGAIAALLMGMQQQGALGKDVPRLRFCLIFAGIRVRDPLLSVYLDIPVRCPAMHIIGDKDYVLKAAYDLKDAFVHAKLITHPRGHVIPRLDKPALQQLRGFLLEQQIPICAL